MSKNNVNPDHYKTAGRERPGQAVVQEIQKQKFTEAKAQESMSERQRTGSKYITNVPENAPTASNDSPKMDNSDQAADETKN